MSRAIELLIKLHDPKCVSIESEQRGRGCLYQEQILSAFSHAEHEFPLGFHMLMLKYRADNYSRNAIQAAVDHWLAHQNITEISAKQALYCVVDMLADIPLREQQKRLKSLRNRYLRSQFSHLKVVERADNVSQQADIEHNSKEARQLRRQEIYALRKSTICPRCRGTGEVGRASKKPCPECEGKGRLRATIYHLMKSVDCSEDYFKRHLNALVVEFEQLLYAEMSSAERVIKVRLRNEIDSDN